MSQRLHQAGLSSVILPSTRFVARVEQGAMCVMLTLGEGLLHKRLDDDVCSSRQRDYKGLHAFYGDLSGHTVQVGESWGSHLAGHGAFCHQPQICQRKMEIRHFEK